MTEAPNIEMPKLPSSGKLIATLAGIAMMSGLLVVMTYQLTKPRIMQNQQDALERAVFSVLEGATTRANFYIDTEGLSERPGDDIGGSNLFAGYDEDGNLVGLALEASARGYQDVVKILYGYNPETECIVGITVLQSTETPGLGDKISKDPDFLANFDCLEAKLNEARDAVAHEIVTVKNGKKEHPWQIDGISGATVTSTAVGDALRNSTKEMLVLIHQHGDWE